MIRHIVAMKWKESVSPEQIEAVAEALGKLPSAIDCIRSYAFGPDAGIGGNFDFAVVAEFDDAAGYKTYSDHPAHLSAVELILPIRADRATVQFEV